jgi:hypothetical protein
MIIEVSCRTFSVALIDSFAAFGDDLLQLVGFLAGERWPRQA